MTAEELLRRHHLFGALKPDEARALLEHVRVRHYRPGVTVFRRGDPGDGLYAVLAGRIVVVVESEAGKELILNVFGVGDFFGEIALLDGKGRTATAIARQPSELLFLARRAFLPFIEQRPEIATRMIALLCERLRRTTELVEDSTFLSVATRLAKQLLLLAGVRGEGDVPSATIDISQAELAKMLGVSREAVSKQLSQWSEAGVISISRGRIVIGSPAYLEQIIGLA